MRLDIPSASCKRLSSVCSRSLSSVSSSSMSMLSSGGSTFPHSPSHDVQIREQWRPAFLHPQLRWLPFLHLQEMCRSIKSGAGFKVVGTGTRPLLVFSTPTRSGLFVARRVWFDRITTAAVSYTHLDVYKRQAYHFSRITYLYKPFPLFL